MAKSELKIQAQKARKGGSSIKEIAHSLGVSQSTASLWCREIQLTPNQEKKLVEKQKAGGHSGRALGAKTQKQKRIDEIDHLNQEGLKALSSLTDQELLIAGLGIYWGEGLKTGGVTGIVNSDPKLILFMVNWLKKCFQLKTEDFICRVGINQAHQGRLNEIQSYWSNLTKIPVSQFTKAGVYQASQKKVYINESAYHGTLTIKVRRSTSLQRRILGLIHGLNMAA